MKKPIYILFLIVVFGIFSGYSQKKQEDLLFATDTIETKINPLIPAKAAFYSAILPGLGQAYNKKYWKIPIVIGAIGGGIYAYSWNKNKYNAYRDAYKERLLVGEINTTDEFKGILTSDRLIVAQKFHQRQKDLSLLVTVGLYILNIIDANVDGHLRQFNVSGKLTVRPEIYQNEMNYKQNLGVALNYHF